MINKTKKKGKFSFYVCVVFIIYGLYVYKLVFNCMSLKQNLLCTDECIDYASDGPVARKENCIPCGKQKGMNYFCEFVQLNNFIHKYNIWWLSYM